jgi:hypothetical protein
MRDDDYDDHHGDDEHDTQTLVRTSCNRRP